MGITGTRWLPFRDVPRLIKEHVHGTVALDYGCGTAWSTLFLKSLGFEVEGVDINEHMIKLAKQRDPQSLYTLIESGKILQKNYFYDFVFSSWVLPYNSSKNELEKVVADIARVLKSGGTFIAFVASENAFKHEWCSVTTAFQENKNLVSGSRATVQWRDNGLYMYFYYWTENDYKEVLNAAGFKIVCIERPLGHLSDGFNWVSETHTDYGNIYVAIKQ